MLPGLDGYEVCRQMRLIRRLADVPVVFLTARSPDEDRPPRPDWDPWTS